DNVNDNVITVEANINLAEINNVNEEGTHYSSEIAENISTATEIFNITQDYHIDTTLTINGSNLIIEGNNHTIYGEGKQAFKVNGENVTIQNLNFINCYAFNGGAIEWSGDEGLVSACNFISCSADNWGAAIEWKGGYGVVSDCSFVNSHAFNGAIYWYDGVDGVVSDCSFVNCSSKYGGAIYWFMGKTAIVSDCSFVNCSSNYGGAIYADYDVNCVVSACSFVNCSADNLGGAIECNDVNGIIRDCSFVNCYAHDGGGAIYAVGDSLVNIGTSNFTNCSSFMFGGAIYLYDGVDGVVSDCSFVNCSSLRGGAIYLYDINVGIINYNIFESNTANRGKDICIHDSNVNIAFNFFGFENNVTEFPNLIYDENFKEYISPTNWVVLDISLNNSEYYVNFIDNMGFSLKQSMPNYTANLKINDDAKEITIKNNTFNDSYSKGDYLLTSPNSGNVLATATLGLVDCNITTGDLSGIGIVMINVPAGVDGDVIVKVDGKEFIGTIKDNSVVIPIIGLNPGTYVLNIYYPGNDYYLPFNTTANLTIYENPEPLINVSIEDDSLSQDVILNVALPVDATGDVTLATNDMEITKTLEKGKVSFNINNLASISEFSLKYTGDNNYKFRILKALRNGTKVIVIPEIIPIEAIVNNISYGDNISGFVNAEVPGSIALYPGKGSFIYRFDSTGPFTNEWKENLTPGNYNAIIVFVSNEGNYKGIAKIPYTISKATTKISIELVKGKVGEKVIITAIVTDQNDNPIKNGTITIDFNGKKYKTEVIDGIATIELILPNEGKYSATAYYEESDLYNSSFTVFTVEVTDIPNPNPNPNPNVNPNHNSINNGVGVMENTGNPLLVLLIALCTIGFGLRRKL
ncbi:MAG: Ig-like domain-containing protein, partial [Methanobacteriaceae archaeon]|nr:Ig-like domain-containing protein [Methanobacteriaceae archaeon]